jgi:hypothetical protein
MKELFKIEKVRERMPLDLRPTRYNFNNFMNGNVVIENPLTPEQVDAIIKVVDEAHADAIKFLKTERKKLK